MAVSSEKQDNLPDRQEKLKEQMFLLEDKENEWSVCLKRILDADTIPAIIWKNLHMNTVIN